MCKRAGCPEPDGQGAFGFVVKQVFLYIFNPAFRKDGVRVFFIYAEENIKRAIRELPLRGNVKIRRFLDFARNDRGRVNPLLQGK